MMTLLCNMGDLSMVMAFLCYKGMGMDLHMMAYLFSMVGMGMDLLMAFLGIMGMGMDHNMMASL